MNNFNELELKPELELQSELEQDSEYKLEHDLEYVSEYDPESALEYDPESGLNSELFSNKEDLYAVIAKNNSLAKKVLFDVKLGKKLTLVNDFTNFYYLPVKKSTLLYSPLEVVNLKHKKFPSLQLNTPISLCNITYKDKSVKNHPLLALRDEREKSAIILNSSKGGFNVFYRGLIGTLSKKEFLRTTQKRINYSETLLEKNLTIKTKTCVSNCALDIYFPTIKYNFSKNKRRRITFTSNSITFINKNYEKAKKNDKVINEKDKKVKKNEEAINKNYARVKKNEKIVRKNYEKIRKNDKTKYNKVIGK